MIKNISEIETSLGLPAGEFKKLYDDAEEKVIDLAPYEIVKKTDLQERMKNYANEEFKTKKDAILEIYNKEVFRDVFSMTIDKTMPAKELAALAKAKVLADAKITPDAKVAELQTDLEKMRANAAEWERKHGDLANATAAEKKQFQMESLIVAELPKAKTKIPVQDLQALFILNHKPSYNDAGIMVFHNEKGEVIKNPATLNPATLKEVMIEFQTPYIDGAAGGTGGVDNPGAAKEGSFDAFIKEMEAKGIKMGSSEFTKEQVSRLRSKPPTLKM